MNYIIAGGAGFLGSHLAKALMGEGHHVTILDNLCTGQMENVKSLFGRGDFSFLRLDINDPCLADHLGDGPYDGIFNLACPASPIHYQNIPIETTLTCVVGSNNLLMLAKKYGCRILQASTSEVYGDPEITPQPETYVGHVNSYGPRACYDEGKRAAEALFYDYKRIHKVDTRVVRIFNTYGPNMCVDDGRVVSNFIVQALRGTDITIYGDGYQTRSFCYVDDLVRGLIAFFNQNEINGPMNLGNPEEFTMLELAEAIIDLTGSKSKIIHLPLPKDDPTQRCPDITLARSIGWKPSILLNQGLPPTINYFKTKLGV